MPWRSKLDISDDWRQTLDIGLQEPSDLIADLIAAVTSMNLPA